MSTVNESNIEEKKAELTDLQKVIIATLQEFHEFCQEHDLTYHLGGGTLLGAIRHKGIIPWDDDIDVDMPREDYERLLKLAEQFPSPYVVKHFELDNNYVYPFVKIYNPKLQVTEFFGEQSYTSGAWIDVFPMDGVFSNITVRKLHFYFVKTLRFLFQLKVRGYQKPHKTNTRFNYYLKIIVKYLMFLVIFLVSKRSIFLIMDKAAKIKSYNNSEFCGAFYSPYGVKASFPKNIYKKTLQVAFNERFFNAPSGYDLFLTKQYGDYMTPPSLEERVTHNIQIGTLDD